MHHAHRVLDGYPLHAACLVVLLGAAEARQDQRPPAVDEVAAVELRAHLDGQLAVAQRLEGVGGVGRAKREVAAQRDEDLHLAALHRLDRLDRVQPVLARRVDPADLGEPVEERRVGRWSMPQVRLPWTLLCPRTGDGPAPSRPMLPRSRSRLTISRTVSTPCSCWVRPRHQAMITRFDADVESASFRIVGLGNAGLASICPPTRWPRRARGTPRSPWCGAR